MWLIHDQPFLTRLNGSYALTKNIIRPLEKVTKTPTWKGNYEIICRSFERRKTPRGIVKIAILQKVVRKYVLVHGVKSA